jgi:Protein of unknown function (DUF2510)
MTDYTSANDPIPEHGDPLGAYRGLAPGWYRDPANPASLRFWDGNALSESVQPAPAPVVDPFAAYRGLAPGWYRDPANPASLRFWDGNALSEAAQPTPAPVVDPFAAYRGLAPGWYRDLSDPSSLRYWDGVSLSLPTRGAEPMRDPGASRVSPPGALPNTATPTPFAPRPANDIRFEPSRLGTGDLIAGAGAVLLFISLFLPWFSVSVGVIGISVSANGLYHGWMYITLLLSLAIVGYLVVRAAWNGLRVPIPHWQLLAAATGLNFVLTIIAFLDKPTGTSWSFGAFVGIAVAVGALVGSVVRAQQPEVLDGHAPQNLR